MKVVLQAKTCVFLSVSSVLVAWTLVAVHPVLAQVRAPSCPSPRQIVDFREKIENEEDEPEDGRYYNPANDSWGKILPGESTAQEPVQDFMIRVPPLASGELTVRTRDNKNVDATLCRGSKRIVTHEPDQPGQLMIEMEPVSTGDYFLAVRAKTTGSYMVNVMFDGVLPRDNSTDDTGSLTQNNQRDDYPITINDSGLLTVATRGRRDTKGMLYKGEEEIAEDDDSGGGGNFRIVTPVMEGQDYVVYVEGQTGTERGDYTVVVDFKNATSPVEGEDGCSPFPIICTKEIEERGDADYFFITPDNNAFMTVETHKSPNTAPRETNTRGTLFGPNKQLAADSDTGDGTNFRLTVPVLMAEHYVVKVEAEGESLTTPAEYRLEVSYQDVMGEVVEVPSQSQQDIEMTLTAPTGNEPVQVDRYVLDVLEAGTLQVSTTGTTDTFGTLIGPDGRQLAEDDDSGANENFQITRRVTTGLHGVTVQGAQRAEAGQYQLVVNFIENSGVTPPPPDPTPDPTPAADDHDNTPAQATRVSSSSSTQGELEIETDADYFQIVVTLPGTLTVETTGATDTQGRLVRDGVPVADDDDSKDGKNFQIVHNVSPGTYYVRVTGYSGARGAYTLAVRLNTLAAALENPPHGASRSGIGVISGWVCEADTVEIELIRGDSTYRVPVAYGTGRDDTRLRCGDDGKNGFGLTWNWNLLAEGRWTVRALADGTEFDSASVDVVHLTDQEFAEGLAGECRVPNFPSAGQTTLLEWEESSQNFQIVGKE